MEFYFSCSNFIVESESCGCIINNCDNSATGTIVMSVLFTCANKQSCLATEFVLEWVLAAEDVTRLT